nr:hypothetical protein [uncultured Terrisporobacter sp.]
MDVIEKIMKLYPNQDINKVRIYKSMGIDSIRQYLNNKESDDEIESKYKSALLLYLINVIEYSKNKGVSTIKQGNKSVTYTSDRKAFQLTSDVKGLLPMPRIRVMG